ncbi:TetR/AcrR family transcriptional regulator [Streptomyces sp. NA04227]|uniref:TetR/AcrR family transcriptional regulator n=1 Tax=Streptomyces sp. NA04227 TaxID=2742136 RepID=UPI0015904E98|nr:TetR/AcrR family transcriptional regulator [Streptomyces sp. NA04227]QKW10380.1 TetR/AcrR family transcriptional regulator [Streptomyces sp. NA04227]
MMISPGTPGSPASEARAGRVGKRVRMPRPERQRQLLDVAEDLFTTRGFAGTSIEDIARAAGVTRPVVYDLLGDKDAVLLACVARARRDFEDRFTQAVTAVSDGEVEDILRAGGEVFFTMLEADQRRWAVLFSSTTATSGFLAEQLTDLRVATVRKIAELAHEFLPDANEEQVHALAHTISGVGEQLGRWWLREPHIPRERIVDYYLQFIAAGVTTVAPEQSGARSTP